MNRLFFEPSLPASASTPFQGMAQTGNSHPQSTSQPAALLRRSSLNPQSWFSPLHYEPGYAYPLMVWLHGCGGDERQLGKVMPHISVRNYAAVSVRGADKASTGRGFAWLDSEDSILKAESRIFDAVIAAQDKFNINPDRVFLAGYQSGGTMAVRLALRHPEQFAGALSICGAFPSGAAPLAKLSAIRNVPLMMAFGRDSQTYSIDQVCADLPLFHTAGMKVELRQYPCGDEITTKMLSDMDTWMMTQVTGMVASPGDDQPCEPLGSEWN